MDVGQPLIGRVVRGEGVDELQDARLVGASSHLGLS